ncbi:MAG TPA: hypothetical protein VKB23_13990 [Solirubrobacterales bacterium]|nr:hypothetical protein [Solirubrobacterales bacterium]
MILLVFRLSLGIQVPDIDLKLADWAAIAQIALAVLALGALVGAMVQIRAARSTSQVAITYNYTERFSEVTRKHLADAYGLLLLGGEAPEDRFLAFLDWDPLKQLDALVVPNLIEEIAGMYNHGLLHRAIAEDFFGVLAAEMWQTGSWFITRYRDHADDRDFYCQWEKMLRGIGRAEEAGLP